MAKESLLVMLSVGAVLSASAAPGLHKAIFNGNRYAFFDIESDIVANSTGVVLYPEEMYPPTKVSLPEQTTIGWAGYMWMKTGEIYNFKGCYDDFVFAKIANQVVLSKGRECEERTGYFAPEKTGWYKVDFRVGNYRMRGGCYERGEYGILWNTNKNRLWRRIGGKALFKTDLSDEQSQLAENDEEDSNTEPESVTCATCRGRGVIYKKCELCHGTRYLWVCKVGHRYCGYGSVYTPMSGNCTASRNRINCPNCAKGRGGRISIGRIESSCPDCFGKGKTNSNEGKRTWSTKTDIVMCAPNRSARRLSGTQTDSSTELSAGEVYRISNRYIVPKNSELIIREGACLLFDIGAGIVVQGKIFVNGTSKNPVVFKSESSGRDIWDGIEIFGNNDSRISGAYFSGAKTAIKLSVGNVFISSTVFSGNGTAMHAQGHYNGGSTLENCLICDNDMGVSYHFSALTFRNCTIVRNNKVGVCGQYYGDIQFENCIITGNGKGIQDGGYSGKACAHRCVIYDNGEFDVNCRSSNAGDFRENWWGPSSTQLLVKEGDGVKLPSMKGNFVDVSAFLRNPPTGCGARDYPGSKGSKIVREADDKLEENGKSDMGTEVAPENGASSGAFGSGETQEVETESAIPGDKLRFVRLMPLPDDTQLQKAAKVVKELCDEDVKALKAGKLDKTKFAQKLMAYSRQSEDAAVKLVLLRNAFKQLLLGGDARSAAALFDKAFAKFGGRFAAEMAGGSLPALRKSAGGSTTADAFRPLLALVEEAVASSKALADAESAIKGNPSDTGARLRCALHATKLMDWELALKTYAGFEGERGNVCSWELGELEPQESDLTAETCGDFWWRSIDGKDEQGLLFRSVSGHAAFWYRKALAEGKMSELKATLVKKRIAKARMWGSGKL